MQTKKITLELTEEHLKTLKKALCSIATTTPNPEDEERIDDICMQIHEQEAQ
jgi:hypothetical protein